SVGGSICFLLALVGLIVYIKNPSLNCSDYTDEQKDPAIIEKIIIAEKSILDSKSETILKIIVPLKEETAALE
ncbi:MAG: hypothetical protein ACFFDW_12395, partial [Candidatus Thorarchaeota archaeon]